MTLYGPRNTNPHKHSPRGAHTKTSGRTTNTKRSFTSPRTNRRENDDHVPLHPFLSAMKPTHFCTHTEYRHVIAGRGHHSLCSTMFVPMLRGCALVCNPLLPSALWRVYAQSKRAGPGTSSVARRNKRPKLGRRVEGSSPHRPSDWLSSIF